MIPGLQTTGETLLGAGLSVAAVTPVLQRVRAGQSRCCARRAGGPRGHLQVPGGTGQQVDVHPQLLSCLGSASPRVGAASFGRGSTWGLCSCCPPAK